MEWHFQSELFQYNFNEFLYKIFFPFNRVERSSDQVIKPVNLEALNKWVGNIPDDVVKDMAEIAPMLSVLGYDPYANPPNYGKADSFVQDNTNKVRQLFDLLFNVFHLICNKSKSKKYIFQPIIDDSNFQR